MEIMEIKCTGNNGNGCFMDSCAIDCGCEGLKEFGEKLKKEIMKEYILCSAIHFDDGKEYVHMPNNISTGFVICGRRHHNCFAILGQVLQEDKGYKSLDDTQGFLTNTNRFVDRQEAWNIAKEANQVIKVSGGEGTLYSEDLW